MCDKDISNDYASVFSTMLRKAFEESVSAANSIIQFAKAFDKMPKEIKKTEEYKKVLSINECTRLDQIEWIFDRFTEVDQNNPELAIKAWNRTD